MIVPKKISQLQQVTKKQFEERESRFTSHQNQNIILERVCGVSYKESENKY